MTRPTRTTLANFKHYDIVLTTAFEARHGISGHTFELIEYYYAITHYTNLSACILLADGTTLDQFHKCVADKYDMEPIRDVFEVFRPKVLLSNNILFVDGSHHLSNCQVFAQNIFLFRCFESDFTYFQQHSANMFLLQDYEVYGGGIGIDYKKKILFQKLKVPTIDVQDTAMMYLTTNCRALPVGQINTIFAKHHHSHNIILTNDPTRFEGANATIYRIPVEDLWNKFTTYIYTNVARQLDCSPRFIAECKFCGKQIILEVDYHDAGLETRLKDSVDTITLNKDDLFLELLREQVKHTRN